MQISACYVGHALIVERVNPVNDAPNDTDVSYAIPNRKTSRGK